MKLIYFIKDIRGGEIMIGVATKGRLEKRIQALQQGNPTELKLLGVIKTRNAMAIARELRATYAASHVRGQWFDPAADLLKFIRSHAVIP
jgi:hypothetical protein